MSIANLYGKTPNTLASISPDVATKQYIPGGVMLSSTIFAPNKGVNAAERIKLFYTKIGNLVTICCRVYVTATGLATASFLGVAEVGIFNAANLGADIVAQLTNDLLERDNNAAGNIVSHELRISGLFVNGAAPGNAVVAHLTAGQISLTTDGQAISALAAVQYFPGSISFLAANTAIVV
jgi:hypothetical protein